MLCEYRSDNAACLKVMKDKFLAIFENAKALCTELCVEVVGDRPCMSAEMDMRRLGEITDRAVAIQSKHFGVQPKVTSGSSDCNIPHSLGIPAVALANYDGGNAHTREEWVVKDSFKPGLMVALELMLTEGEVEI